MKSTSFLTCPEIASILRISKALVYNLIANGDIPSVRFGRTVRVKQEDLEAFIQKCGSPQETVNEDSNSSTKNL